MASTVETLARQSPALYDAEAEVNETSWFKALGRYRAKGMSEKEISKHRAAYQQGQGTTAVQSLASNSKKKK
jgi:hypothetical protein